jgi:hypothetical protein
VIPNITRGGRVKGLIRYLTGPGRENEHTNPRVIAGDEAVLARFSDAAFDADRTAGERQADAIAEHLDHPRLRSPTRVTVAVKGQDGEPTGRRKDAHVWHCSLSLHPDEEPLSSEQWEEICRQFIAEMGFAGAESDPACRWVAIHHGAGKNGNDHVHVVVQLVDEAGRAASVHLDRPRAQKCARELERRHGLRVVEGRDRGRATRATNRRQAERAKREHERNALRVPSSEPDRERLERAVRIASAASSGEADFVRRIRDGGRLLIRPRFAAGRDDQVVGYSVALAPGKDRPVVWHAGGRLAKDLTLPTLRRGWEPGSERSPEAIEEWQRAWRNEPPTPVAGVVPSAQPDTGWEQALEELRNLRSQLATLPAAERGAWADVARQGAAVLYGWAELTPEHATSLRRCAGELSRSAQLPARELQRDRLLPRARGAVMLCAAAMRPGNQLLYWLVLAQELSALTRAVSDMHQAAGEAQRAAQLASALREDLLPVCEQLEGARVAGIASPPRAARSATEEARQAPETSAERSRAQADDAAAAEALRLARIASQDRSPLHQPPAHQPPAQQPPRWRPPGLLRGPRKGR